MKRILIIGCGGSGKSTLARALGKMTGIPVIHLDQLYWRPGWVHVSKDEFDAAVRQEMEKTQWIMDGNFNRTLPERLQHCDTVIYLDFNRFICLLGWLKRVITNWGKSRADMPQDCVEWFDPEFAGWIWKYNDIKRPRNYELLRQAENVNVIILKNRAQVRKFLQSAKNAC